MVKDDHQQCDIAINCHYNRNEVNNTVCERCRNGFPFPVPALNRDIEYIRSFPVGYRFKPSELELIHHYLLNKICNNALPPNKIIEHDVYLLHPAKLTEKYQVYGEVDKEWYFFTPRERRYKNGDRPNRNVAELGFWKATGLDKKIRETGPSGTRLLGTKKALVFYEGKQSKENKKTNWTMHEYTVLDIERPKHTKRLDNWVLCKIYKKKKKKSLSRSSSSNSNHPNGGHLDNVGHEDAEDELSNNDGEPSHDGELANGELANDGDELATNCELANNGELTKSELANNGELTNSELVGNELATYDDLSDYCNYLATGEFELLQDDEVNWLFYEDTSDLDLSKCTNINNDLGPDEHQPQQQRLMSLPEQINSDVHNMQEHQQQQLNYQRNQSIDGTQADLTDY
ncbi:hypothetical protein Sjap_013303 [Stephania japonica]|uniref:NAC domain-containing protein n=1 Tax=Stephania japonica TaxID=461633 RepID=A0AAP0P164_9MAGN